MQRNTPHVSRILAISLVALLMSSMPGYAHAQAPKHPSAEQPKPKARTQKPSPKEPTWPGRRDALPVTELENVVLALIERRKNPAAPTAAIEQLVQLPTQAIRALPPERLDYISLASVIIGLLQTGYRDEAVKALMLFPDFFLAGAPLDPELSSQFFGDFALDLSRQGEARAALPYWLKALEYRSKAVTRVLQDHPDQRKNTTDYSIAAEISSIVVLEQAATQAYQAQNRLQDSELIARETKRHLNEILEIGNAQFALVADIALLRAIAMSGDYPRAEGLIEVVARQIRDARYDGRLLTVSHDARVAPDGLYLVRDISQIAAIIQRKWGERAAEQSLKNLEDALNDNKTLPPVYKSWVRFIRHRNLSCLDPKGAAEAAVAAWNQLRPSLSKYFDFDSYPLMLSWIELRAGHNKASKEFLKQFELQTKRRDHWRQLIPGVQAFSFGSESRFQAGWLRLALGDRSGAMRDFDDILARPNTSTVDSLVTSFLQAGEYQIASNLLSKWIDISSKGYKWVSQPNLTIAGLSAALLTEIGRSPEGTELLQRALLDRNLSLYDFEDKQRTARFRSFKDDTRSAPRFPSSFDFPPKLSINGRNREDWRMPLGAITYKELAEYFLYITDFNAASDPTIDAEWQISQWSALGVFARDSDRAMAAQMGRDLTSFDQQELADLLRWSTVNDSLLRSSNAVLERGLLDLMISPCHYSTQSDASDDNWQAQTSELLFPALIEVPARIFASDGKRSAVPANTPSTLEELLPMADTVPRKQLHSVLADGELLIHTSTFSHFVRVHAFTRDQYWTWNWQISKTALKEKLSKLRSLALADGNGGLPKWSQSSFELSYELFNGLLQQIDKNALKKVNLISFVLDSELGALPTGLLTVEKYQVKPALEEESLFRNAPWLDTVAATRHFPSVSSRLAASASSKAEFSGRMLVFTDPEFPNSSNCNASATNVGRFCSLPYTKNVGTQLRDVWSTGPYEEISGASANKKVLMRKLADSNSPPRVLALLTHGLTPDETSAATGVFDAALVLSEAVRGDEDSRLLTAQQIATLAIPSEWVLLLSCNSAAGDTQLNGGYSGVARSFLKAGAKSILVSHWPLFEESVEHIVPGTVRNSVSAGKAQSLRLAVQRLRNLESANDLSHPVYWGGFSLVGE